MAELYCNHSRPFATLRPVNICAKIAFSEVVKSFVSEYGSEEVDMEMKSLCRMIRRCEKQYDRGVHLYQLQSQTSGIDNSTSDHETVDSHSMDRTEKDIGYGMIWAGYYVFSLDMLPNNPNVGWVAGRSPDIDLPLATGSYLQKGCVGSELYDCHSRFNFHRETAAFYVARDSSRSDHAELAALTVNGKPVNAGGHTLNQFSMNLRIGSLEYLFEYTKFARSESFEELRRRHISSTWPATIKGDFHMPIPLPQTSTIGTWTLNRPLGKGTFGRVYLASNPENEVVAIKVLLREKSNSVPQLDLETELNNLKSLTQLAKEKGDGGRIVCLREMLSPLNRETLNPEFGPFEEVGLVLEPMTPHTFEELIEEPKSISHTITPRTKAALYRDALLGIEFLHTHGWLHGDLKPGNIGFRGAHSRAVLLDIGTACHLAPGDVIEPTPPHQQQKGTIRYQAPERELEGYNHSIDVWAIGVIGIELFYGYHPWHFPRNPWRPGNEDLRDEYCKRYEGMMAELVRESSKGDGGDEIGSGGIQPADLFINMLRHKWAVWNKTLRLNIHQAVRHNCWQPVEPLLTS